MAKFQFHFDIGPVCLQFALFDDKPRFRFDVGLSDKHDCGVFYLGDSFKSGLTRPEFGYQKLHIRGTPDTFGIGMISDRMSGEFTVRYQGVENAYILGDLDDKPLSEVDPIILDIAVYNKLPLRVASVEDLVTWTYLHKHQYDFKTISEVTWGELQNIQ